MARQKYEWERPLITLAVEAQRSAEVWGKATAIHKGSLDRAYAHCESLTAVHSRSFALASRLLPLEKRRAVRALYAFCRTTDDIVDHPADGAPARLQRWREQALHQPSPDDPVALAWADARARHHVPKAYAEQFVEGVARDLTQDRYGTFAELAAYCYGVASTVGLMSMHIIGYSRKEAVPYAVRLGVALQLTNILRDVAEDWERGRLYLPQEELAFFGVREADIAKGIVNDNWRTFLKFQIERARRLYAEAWPGIAMLAPEGRLAIAAAADFYCGILDDIEAHDYDVFSRRAHLSRWGKLRRLPGLWWRTRKLSSPQVETLAPQSSPMPGLDG